MTKVRDGVNVRVRWYDKNFDKDWLDIYENLNHVWFHR